MLVVFGLGLLAGLVVSDQQDGAVVPGRPRPRDGPREVVQQYFQAQRAGDPDQSRQYLCRSARPDDLPVPGGQGQDVFGLLGWQVGGERVTATQAAVDVDLEVPIVGAIPLTVGWSTSKAAGGSAASSGAGSRQGGSTDRPGLDRS